MSRLQSAIAIVSAVLAWACVLLFLPDTPLGRVGAGAAAVILLFPVRMLFPIGRAATHGRYWLGGALFVGRVAAFEWLATTLRVRETEWATFGILGFAALGWLASLMLRRPSAGGRGEGMSTRATE